MDGCMDPGRYGNAERFFDYVRSRLRSVDTMRERLALEQSWVRAVRYDGPGGSGAPGSPTEAAAQRLMEREEAYAASIADAQGAREAAEAAIDAMQRDGADAPGDAEVLRCYYILGWKTGRVAQALHYNSKYIPDKRAVALMHVAPYVPLDW